MDSALKVETSKSSLNSADITHRLVNTVVGDNAADPDHEVGDKLAENHSDDSNKSKYVPRDKKMIPSEPIIGLRPPPPGSKPLVKVVNPNERAETSKSSLNSADNITHRLVNTVVGDNAADPDHEVGDKLAENHSDDSNKSKYVPRDKKMIPSEPIIGLRPPPPGSKPLVKVVNPNERVETPKSSLNSADNITHRLVNIVVGDDAADPDHEVGDELAEDHSDDLEAPTHQLRDKKMIPKEPIGDARLPTGTRELVEEVSHHQRLFGSGSSETMKQDESIVAHQHLDHPQTSNSLMRGKKLLPVFTRAEMISKTSNIRQKSPLSTLVKSLSPSNADVSSKKSNQAQSTSSNSTSSTRQPTLSDLSTTHHLHDINITSTHTEENAAPDNYVDHTFIRKCGFNKICQNERVASAVRHVVQVNSHVKILGSYFIEFSMGHNGIGRMLLDHISDCDGEPRFERFFNIMKTGYRQHQSVKASAVWDVLPTLFAEFQQIKSAAHEQFTLIENQQTDLILAVDAMYCDSVISNSVKEYETTQNKRHHSLLQTVEKVFLHQISSGESSGYYEENLCK